jgi:putative nucleotidyltransferase with HDIG domain
MIKKIRVEKLRPGMFIQDFNCGWMRHPFFRNSVKITDDSIIDKVIEYGIREVYIDTEKGEDVSDAPSAESVREAIQQEMNSVEAVLPVKRQSVPLNEEVQRAKGILKDASVAVRTIMQDVRFGRQIELEKSQQVVNKIFSSILRNADALISLTRIKKAHEYTYSHCLSVCALMLSFCNHLGYDQELIREIGIGALLHDIGKMMMPMDLLNKKGVLTETEFEMIKGHVEHGRILLEQSGNYSDLIMSILSQHHEREDGSGYPHGLSGDEISRYGKAIAIIDVYDALTSDRCYKYRLEPTETLRKLYEWGKFHFNNELVQKFIQCIGIYPTGTLVRLESGWIGVVVQQSSSNLLRPVVRAIYNTKTESYPRVPFDIDLVKPENNGGDRIVTHEVPHKWNIQPEMYL